MYGEEAGESEALSLAADFVWTREQEERDTRRLAEVGSLGDLITLNRAERAGTRLSVERVREVAAWVPELGGDAEFVQAMDTLLEIAQHGMQVRPPPGFIPSGAPQTRRVKEMKMERPIAKLIGECWKSGFCLLVKSAAILNPPPGDSIPHDRANGGGANGNSSLEVAKSRGAKVTKAAPRRLNWANSGWARKRGKPKGRATHDASYTVPASSSLNLPRDLVRNIAIEQYGPMYLPELRADLISMVLAAGDEWGWGELELLKIDLSGAFHLLDFDSASAQLMMSELMGELTAIWVTGNFGHAHTPYAFYPLSVFLSKVCNALGAQGGFVYRLKVYVDDLLPVCRRGLATKCQSDVYRVIRALLGPGAVAEEKTECSLVSLEWIGWSVDLERRAVAMSRHTTLKTLFYIDKARDGTIKVKDMEVLASLIERFSSIAPCLASFKDHLYGSIHGMLRGNARVNLDDQCRLAISLAESLLVRYYTREEGLSFDDFRVRPTEYVVEYDGSIHGLGIRVFRIVNTTGRVMGEAVGECEWTESAGVRGVGLKPSPTREPPQPILEGGTMRLAPGSHSHPLGTLQSESTGVRGVGLKPSPTREPSQPILEGGTSRLAPGTAWPARSSGHTDTLVVEELLLDISLDLPAGVAGDAHRRLVQNGCELLAATIGLCALKTLGVRGAGVQLRGDSCVSGAWLTKGTFKSPYSKRCALLWLVLSAEDGLQIAGFTHLPARLNKWCDNSSRGVRPTLTPEYPHAILAYPGMNDSVVEPLSRLVDRCNPVAALVPLVTREAVQGFMEELSLTLSSLPLHTQPGDRDRR